MISAIVFTGWPEEENYIDACLKTISWVDEIVIIDNGATKKTIEQCLKYKAKVVNSSSGSDLATLHNLGKEKAKGEWLLYIDADERISKSLQQEIRAATLTQEHSAYKLNRVNFFLGKIVLFGDRYPDKVTRLFKRDKLEGWSGEIHESSRVFGAIGELKNPLYHLTHRDIDSMLRKTAVFTSVEAKIRLEMNHPPIVGWRLVRVFLSEFITRIVKYQGWRQGTEGWIDGIFQSFSLFIVYAKLWELQRKPELSETYSKIDSDILEGKI